MTAQVQHPETSAQYSNLKLEITVLESIPVGSVSSRCGTNERPCGFEKERIGLWSEPALNTGNTVWSTSRREAQSCWLLTGFSYQLNIWAKEPGRTRLKLRDLVNCSCYCNQHRKGEDWQLLQRRDHLWSATGSCRPCEGGGLGCKNISQHITPMSGNLWALISFNIV